MKKMKEYHFRILKFLEDGWQKYREKSPYYIFLRKDNEEMKISLSTGNIVSSPYSVVTTSNKN